MHTSGTIGCYLDGGHQVLLAVGAQFADGQLATRQDDWLGKVFEHKGECGGGICHRVGAVQDDEAVVVVVVVGDEAYYLRPSHRVHVAGVDGWVELSDVDVSLYELELRHRLHQVVEVEWFECACLRVLSHADGTSGVYDENLGCCHCFFTLCYYIVCKSSKNICICKTFRLKI